MTFFATREDIRRIDRLAVESGVQVRQMMELAGYHIVPVFNRLKIRKDKKAFVLVGKGNKGGDGLCAARHLINSGWQCAVCITHDEMTEDSTQQLEILRKMKVNIFKYKDSEEFEKVLGLSDVIIDALIGYNLDGAPRGVFKDIIAKVNAVKKFVIAYDIPTGMDTTTGECFDPTIQADCTLSMALPKEAFRHDKAKEVAGMIFIADIGIPNHVYEMVAKNSRPQFLNGLFQL